MQSDHDYSDSPNMTSLTEYKQAAISYITGYVAKMVIKKTLCSRCCEALGSRNHAATSSFMRLKDRGGLFKPTQSVFKICEKTEQRFQKLLASTNGKLPQGNNLQLLHAIFTVQALFTMAFTRILDNVQKFSLF